jgi:hypothetical protein
MRIVVTCPGESTVAGPVPLSWLLLLSLPQRFYAFYRGKVTIDTGWGRHLFLAQRFARHVSPLTTTIYTHPSDEDLWAGVRRLSC